MLVVGCDHGGFKLKQEIIKMLKKQEVVFEDVGVFSEESVDYPDIAELVCKKILSGACKQGILLCGTGLGINIAANKFQGIRAAQCHDTFSAQMSREHNDANVLTMGGRVIGADLACEIVQKWLGSNFQAGRHSRRVEKIKEIERKQA